MKRALFLLTLLGCFSCLHAAHIETHLMESEYQGGKQEIRVLVPDNYRETTPYRVLYVLPVENGLQDGFGDGLGGGVGCYVDASPSAIGRARRA